jgi:hypothetical protein
MFCPVCKYEFRRGFTHCNTCDVDLVETLPPEEEIDHSAPATAAQMDHPTLLWSGASGGIFSALTTALDEAQIPYNKEELDARLVFSSQHADLEVWVPAANLPQAKPILDSVLANPLNSDEAASNASEFEEESSAAEDEDDEDYQSEDDIRHNHIARELFPDEATAEVWSGKDENMADMLKSCLNEIGINCYLHTPDAEEFSDAPDAEEEEDYSDAPFAIRVLPEDEKRARQIVRSITDGLPPQ